MRGELAKALATPREPSSVNVNIPSELKIPAPQVQVNVPRLEQPEIRLEVRPDVNVAAPSVKVIAPKPQIDVHVAAPEVRVAAPVVTVEAAKQAPGVQQVEIVGMPDRESSTVTKVERRQSGEIVSTETVTRESDVVTPRKRSLLDRLLGRQ